MEIKQIEQKLAGGLVECSTIVDQVVDVLNAEMLTDFKSRCIVEAVYELYKQGKSIDSVTAFNQIAKLGYANEVSAYELEKMLGYISADLALEYVDIIRANYIKRKLSTYADELKGKSTHESNDAYEVLDSLYKQADDLYAGISKGESFESFTSQLNEAKEDLSKPAANISGIPSGLADLDAMTNGFQPTDLVILAARPAMGKSALMTTMITNAAAKDYSVGVFSLEMSKRQIICRMISEAVNIPANDLTKNKLTDYQRSLFKSQVDQIRPYKVFINDNTELNITTLKAELKKMKHKHDIDIAYVDYLQLMSGDAKAGNREQEISNISRGLKTLAKELKIPIVALSQLSRKVDDRENKRPYLSDLRESGAIEQDADMVLFLYRPYYYIQQKGETVEDPSIEKEANLSIAKHRNGELANIQLVFEGKYSKFYDKQFISRSPLI